MRRVLALSTALICAIGLLAVETAPATANEDCPDLDDIEVPEAEFVQARCLEDLTTAGNPYTDTTPNAGAGTREDNVIHSEHTEFPEVEVPGVQVEGYFADSCDRYQPETTDFMPVCDNGLRHNSQFVIRVPNDWDGETLVVAGTPGIRAQFASDLVLSDWVLTRGWAYAAQDKGNTGVNFFRAGDTETDGSATEWVPGKAMEQWAELMGTTAASAQGMLERVYGTAPARTYAAGLSNGGYQTRLAIEHHPELYDGGVDWAGHPMLSEGPNLYTYIPSILRNYPEYQAGSAEAYDALVHEGRLPPHSEPIWEHHYVNYWGITPTVYRPAIDPEYTDYVATPSFVVPPGHPDAEYDYHERPDFVRDRMDRLATVGETHGKPLILLHPDLDALVPISTASDPYVERVRARGHGDALRYYVVEGGTHVDSLADDHPDEMRPVLPCFIDALDELDAWVAEGEQPPPSGLIPNPDVDERVQANECGLPEPVERTGGSDAASVSLEASRRGFGIVETVVVAAADRPLDALVAGPLAASHDGPLLLVDDEVDDALASELHRTGALEAIVVGDTDAVSEQLVTGLEDEGLEVSRVSGDGDAGTAAAVAADVGAPDGEAFVVTDGAVAASSIGALAAVAQAPVLLVDEGAIPEATSDALDALGVERTIVVAADGEVREDVIRDLPGAEVIGGADGLEVNAEALRVGLERGHSLETLYVAPAAEPAYAALAAPVGGGGGKGG
jgi:hypothetical protein